jgi:hypothetical protein
VAGAAWPRHGSRRGGAAGGGEQGDALNVRL